jgi:DNA-directed RNA polymerase subunit M/transcription elongation factor TFIIS
MHFCDKCNNMYYIRLSSEEEDKLIYYCRNCGNEDTNLTKNNICVSKTQLKRSEQKYNHIINEYTKLDPTLPRINSIRCPNNDCISNTCKNKGEGAKKSSAMEESNICDDREVIYIRYDDLNKLYIYLCAKCDTVWKTEKNN